MSRKRAPLLGTQHYEIGNWCRFDRYEIREGFVAPAEDARIEHYNPWATVNPSTPPRPYQEPVEPPYKGLVALGDQAIELNGELTPELQTAVLTWCASHGLLGLGLQHTQLIRLAPRWQRPAVSKTAAEITDPDDKKLLAQLAAQIERIPGVPPNAGNIARPQPNSSSKKLLVAVQRQYVRLPNGEWDARYNELLAFRPRGVRRREGAVIPLDLLPSSFLPHVGRHDPESHEWVETPLTAQPLLGSAPPLWGDYFPQVPAAEKETYAYPRPLSDQFWQGYAEPIDTFLLVAAGFAAIVRGLLADPKFTTTLQRYDQASMTWDQRLTVLNGMLGETGPLAYRLSDGSVQQKWVSPSLLADYAMMALRDVSKHRVRLCDGCKKLMQASRPNKRYCTDACRWQVQQERRRKRRKAAARRKK